MDLQTESRRSSASNFHGTHQEDLGTRLVHGVLEEFDYERLLSKRLSTEACILPGWGRTDTHTANAPEHPFTISQTTDFSKFHRRQSQSTRSQVDEPRFRVTECGKYVTLISGPRITLYELFGTSQTLELVVNLSAGTRVLAVSMDTTHGRSTLAALTENGTGVTWDLSEYLQSEALIRVPGEDIGLGLRTEVQGARMFPDIHAAPNTGTGQPQEYDAESSRQSNKDSTSAHTGQKAWSSSSFRQISESHNFPSGQTADYASSARYGRSRAKSTHLRPSTVFESLGTSSDLPRSIAVCSQRDCVAFGCARGIELHWVDSSTGSKLTRWFPSAIPSDYLYFLPSNLTAIHNDRLRLLASAAGPVFPVVDTIRVRSPSQMSAVRSESQPSIRSLTRRFSVRLPISSSQESPTPTTNAIDSSRAAFLYSIEVDHYHSIPLSDGLHAIFTDSTTGLVCIGFPSTLNDPSTMLRKVYFTPLENGEPGTVSSPLCYRASHELRYGVRVVVAYTDGRIMLYNVPPAIFEGISDAVSDWELRRKSIDMLNQFDVDHIDLFTPVPEVQEDMTSPAYYRWRERQDVPNQSGCLQVTGVEILRVSSGVQDLCVSCYDGGIKVWMFQNDGTATLLDIYKARQKNVRYKMADDRGRVRNVVQVNSEDVGADEEALAVFPDEAAGTIEAEKHQVRFAM